MKGTGWFETLLDIRIHPAPRDDSPVNLMKLVSHLRRQSFWSDSWSPGTCENALAVWTFNISKRPSTCRIVPAYNNRITDGFRTKCVYDDSCWPGVGCSLIFFTISVAVLPGENRSETIAFIETPWQYAVDVMWEFKLMVRARSPYCTRAELIYFPRRRGRTT